MAKRELKVDNIADLDTETQEVRMNIQKFNGKGPFLGYREMYEKGGEWFPGRKGINFDADALVVFLKTVLDNRATIEREMKVSFEDELGLPQFDEE